MRPPPRSTLFPYTNALPIYPEMAIMRQHPEIGASIIEPVSFLGPVRAAVRSHQDRKSTRLNSSHSQISYAVFCLKKKKEASRPRMPVDGVESVIWTQL